MFKSGFVAIVGRPNVGKSTLLNHLLKKKVAIMSNVAQTTRTTLQGIYTDDKSQIIFIDTPGVHRPQDLLGNFMNTTAISFRQPAEILPNCSMCRTKSSSLCHAGNAAIRSCTGRGNQRHRMCWISS